MRQACAREAWEIADVCCAEVMGCCCCRGVAEVLARICEKGGRVWGESQTGVVFCLLGYRKATWGTPSRESTV